MERTNEQEGDKDEIRQSENKDFINERKGYGKEDKEKETKSDIK